MNARLLPTLALTAAVLVLPVQHASAADSASDSEALKKLEQQVDAMQKALDATRQELQALKAQNEALAAAQQQQATQQQAAAAAPARSAVTAGGPATIGGQAPASPSDVRTIGGGISDNVEPLGLRRGLLHAPHARQQPDSV